jgi:hypothetical protein
MPGRDGTGPRGLGSRTGWGWGDCKPEAVKDLTSKMDDSTQSIPRAWRDVEQCFWLVVQAQARKSKHPKVENIHS